MIKYLSQLKNKNWANEVCLVRTDFNVEGSEKSFRLNAALPTLQFLIKKGAKIVILSHRGRPFGLEKEFSLEWLVPFLNKNLGVRVKFIEHFDFEKIKKAIDKESAPAVFLLDNLRFLRSEVEGNDEALAKNLASLGTCYINDAFAVSHRNNTSIATLPKFLPHYAGFLLENEINAFAKVMENPEKPLVLILGGAKISEKIGVIENFAEMAENILIGGGIANTFFAAQEIDIGESLYEPKMVDWTRRFLLTKTAKRIVFPVDWVKEHNKILDIGSMTIEIFSSYIKRAKSVVWNGPLGKYEEEKYKRGSIGIINAIVKSNAFSIVGGGETTQLISELGLESKFGFLSTGGGAMLDFLSGKPMPGIEALKT